MTLKPPTNEATFTMSVSLDDGTWLDINDGNKYVVSGESLGISSVSFRKTEAQSPYIEGRFLIHAVKDMVEENIVVWVSGYPYNTNSSGQHQLRENIDALLEAFEQLSYTVKYTFGNSQVEWNCQTANYSVEFDRQYIHRLYVPVKLAVPRFPTVTRSSI